MDIYIVGLIASVIGLFFTILYRKKLNLRLLIVWVSLWVLIGFFSAFPQTIDILKNIFSVGYRAYFVFTLAIFTLLLLNFYAFAQISELKKEMTKFAQEFALFRYEISEEDIHESSSDHNSLQ
ncbi:MAG: DUF2304 domain-containing protein [Candidatus Methanofastidiosia archaeon]|jgi:hypothetical protein